MSLHMQQFAPVSWERGDSPQEQEGYYDHDLVPLAGWLFPAHPAAQQYITRVRALATTQPHAPGQQDQPGLTIAVHGYQELSKQLHLSYETTHMYTQIFQALGFLSVHNEQARLLLVLAPGPYHAPADVTEQLAALRYRYQQRRPRIGRVAESLLHRLGGVQEAHTRNTQQNENTPRQSSLTDVIQQVLIAEGIGQRSQQIAQHLAATIAPLLDEANWQRQGTREDALPNGAQKGFSGESPESSPGKGNARRATGAPLPDSAHAFVQESSRTAPEMPCTQNLLVSALEDSGEHKSPQKDSVPSGQGIQNLLVGWVSGDSKVQESPESSQKDGDIPGQGVENLLVDCMPEDSDQAESPESSQKERAISVHRVQNLLPAYMPEDSKQAESSPLPPTKQAGGRFETTNLFTPDTARSSRSAVAAEQKPNLLSAEDSSRALPVNGNITIHTQKEISDTGNTVAGSTAPHSSTLSQPSLADQARKLANCIEGESEASLGAYIKLIKGYSEPVRQAALVALLQRTYNSAWRAPLGKPGGYFTKRCQEYAESGIPSDIADFLAQFPPEQRDYLSLEQAIQAKSQRTGKSSTANKKHEAALTPKRGSAMNKEAAEALAERIGQEDPYVRVRGVACVPGTERYVVHVHIAPMDTHFASVEEWEDYHAQIMQIVAAQQKGNTHGPSHTA